MTTRIQNLSDLQDRRIMMEKKLPAFGYALILLVAFLMVFLVIWSTQNKRTYVSQSTGSVQAANKTYIMSSYSGSITELNISEAAMSPRRPHRPHQEHRSGYPAGQLPEAAGHLQEAEEPVRKAAQVHSGRQELLQRDRHRRSAITTSTRATRARSARRRLTLRPIRPPVTPTSRSRP